MINETIERQLTTNMTISSQTSKASRIVNFRYKECEDEDECDNEDESDITLKLRGKMTIRSMRES